MHVHFFSKIHASLKEYRLLYFQDARNLVVFNNMVRCYLLYSTFAA